MVCSIVRSSVISSFESHAAIYHTIPYHTMQGKIKLFFREDQILPEGHILIFSPENVKFRKLNFFVFKLLFSCKLSKTAPDPILALFQRGVDHCSSGSNLQPRQFLPCHIRPTFNIVLILLISMRPHSISWIDWLWMSLVKFLKLSTKISSITACYTWIVGPLRMNIITDELSFWIS